MALFCALYWAAVVHAPKCKRTIFPRKSTTSTYDVLEDNSALMLSIVPNVPRRYGQAVSIFDVRKVVRNRAIIDLYYPRGSLRAEQSRQWRFLRDVFRDPDGSTMYILTEGEDSHVQGLLAGFALVSDITDRVRCLNTVEISKQHRHNGLGGQFLTAVFSALMNSKMNIHFENKVNPASAGAWLFLSSARKAGFTNVHIRFGEKDAVYPLTDNWLDRMGEFNDVEWASGGTNNFMLTLGEHPIYRLSFPRRDTTSSRHILSFDTVGINPILRALWESSCPVEWTAIISDKSARFRSWFVFSPSSTKELLGALLMEVESSASRVKSFIRPTASTEFDRGTLLGDAVFSTLLEDKVIFDKSLMAEWEYVAVVAADLGYSIDVRDDFDSVTIFKAHEPAIEPTLSEPKI